LRITGYARCVEAEVKRRALAVLAAGQAQVLSLDLDHDYGWDDGLICGGRMRVLVEPLAGGGEVPYFRRLLELVERGAGGTEAIVLDADKAALPAPSGYLLDANGRLQAALRTGDRDIPACIRQALQPIESRPGPYAHRGIAFLPLLRRCRLLIVGGGHVGKAVAALAADLDFDVWVVDDRAEFVSTERFPRAQRRITGPLDQTLAQLDVSADTYCLIVTRGHRHDQRALLHLAQRGARYVGMIGSRRKIRLIFADLRAEGVPPAALERVHAPVGVDIGSQTVAEIAVSIAAELVAHRNRQGTVPGRPPAAADASVGG